MPDHDDRLAADLQEYYSRLAQLTAPDVLAKVMLSTGRRASRRRTLAAAGGGLLAASTAAAVTVVALVAHTSSPTSPAPARSASSAPTVAPSPTVVPSPPPTTVPVAVGPPAHGFVPADVTAVSSTQWWVLGYDGASCALASCTRILHTTDAGHTFTSIPTPPVAPGQGQAQADRLRFADPLDGWVVDVSGVVWATHDGGAHWARDGAAGRVVDLEASAGTVYAATCPTALVCQLERSPTSQDGWSLLPASAGHGRMAGVVVNGAHVWAYGDAAGRPFLVASSDAGQTFTAQTLCHDLLAIESLSAVNAADLWATCATGTQASVFRSVDGGLDFADVASPAIPNAASIAGVSSTTAVVGGQKLLRTTDGGHTFATVEDNQTQWTMVGFTTATSGFAFDAPFSGQQAALWRSNDAGVHWYRVQFP